MSFNEINTLRKAGKLEEALELATQALSEDPENIWNKRGAAWVANSSDSSEVLKEFEGKIKLISPNNIGFVTDIFIDPHLVKNARLSSGQVVKGKTILSWNKKKSEWEWKAVRGNCYIYDTYLAIMIKDI